MRGTYEIRTDFTGGDHDGRDTSLGTNQYGSR